MRHMKLHGKQKGIFNFAASAAAGAGGSGGFLSNALGKLSFGNIMNGLGGLFGGISGLKHLARGRQDIQNLPGMSGPANLFGNFGSSINGGLQLDPSLALGQLGLAQGTGLLGGGLFNDPSLQMALGQNDVLGGLNQANAAFSNQLGASPFGLGGLAGQAQGLLGGLAGNVAAGPQDFSGIQNPLFNAGFGNQLAAGDLSTLQNQELATLRQAAAPEINRQFNRLNDRLFARGQLGSTGGAEQLRAFLEAENQADLGFQNQAFGRAAQRSQLLSNLGSSQIGQGTNLLGTNLGQFNAGVNNFSNIGGLFSGLEGQQFNQNLGAGQFNTSQGMNRLQSALGLLSGASGLQAQQMGLGLQSAGGLLDFGNFGLNAAAMPFQLQAGLLQGSGEHASALSALAQARASASGGFLSGFSDRRLKKNIERVGSLGDLGWYQWEWNDKARELGVAGLPNIGVIAQEVLEVVPSAVGEKDGYLTVNYTELYHGI